MSGFRGIVFTAFRPQLEGGGIKILRGRKFLGEGAEEE